MVVCKTFTRKTKYGSRFYQEYKTRNTHWMETKQVCISFHIWRIRIVSNYRSVRNKKKYTTENVCLSRERRSNLVQAIKQFKTIFLVKKFFIFLNFFISRNLFIFRELIHEIKKFKKKFISWSNLAQPIKIFKKFFKVTKFFMFSIFFFISCSDLLSLIKE